MDRQGQRPRSRASNEPYVARDGHVVERDIRETDIDIIRLFEHHRYINAPYAAALLNRSEQGVSRRLRSLKEKQVRYVKICDYQRDNPNDLRVGYLFYDIDDAGINALEDCGITIKPPKAHKHFAHAVMTHQVIMSLQIGVNKRDDLEVDYFKKQRFELKKNEFVISDYPHLAIRSLEHGRSRHLPCIEIDTSREPIRSTDADRSGIRNKINHYTHAIETGLIQKQYDIGSDPFFIPFVTHNETRMRNILDCIAERTAHKPVLRRHFPVKWHPTIKNIRFKPHPTGHVLEEAWMRADGKEFLLGEA